MSFRKPWEKPKLAGVGSKTVPGSRPSKSDRSKTSKSGKKGAKEKKSATHKAQSQKSPPRPEDDLDSQELRDALELSKSDGAGTSKLTDLGQDDTEEEKALREAIQEELSRYGWQNHGFAKSFHLLGRGQLYFDPG